MATMVLGYWGIRGLGAAICYVLEHAGQEYQYKNYSNGSQTAWLEEKVKLGIDFANLPYLIDGDVKLTQSLAILKYLGRKYGLVANGEKDIQRQDVLDGVFVDLRKSLSLMVHTENDFETEKKRYQDERLMPHLKTFDAQLAGRSFLVGNHLTYTDFMFFEFFDVVNLMYDGKLMSQLPNLDRFQRNIANLKGIKEYLASGRKFSKSFLPHAKWGG